MPMPTDLLTPAGQTLQLLPERCIFWRETGILILADLHLGKAAHLRHHGMPVPEGNTADDLTRADVQVDAEQHPAAAIACVQTLHAQQLVHSVSSCSPR